MVKQLMVCLVGLAVLSWPVIAQEVKPPGSRDDNDFMSRPTEHGLRMTPGLARGFARQFVRNALVHHYEMDKEKVDEASEIVARRLMETAHTLDGQGQEFIERFLEVQLAHAAERGGVDGIPPGFGKEFGERLLPMLPTIRDFVRNTGQDIRPMLPFKQQLKLARDLMAFNTAFNGFEETMGDWASGKVDKYGDPFHRDSRNVQQGEDGQSGALRQARKTAQSQLDAGRPKRWKQYVKDAKAFYQFDNAQSATADSVLRECLQRAKSTTDDAAWADRVYRNRLWLQMLRNHPMRTRHPLHTLLVAEWAELVAPMDVLGNELKRRIEDIPTRLQRKAAEERLDTWLADKGFEESQAEARTEDKQTETP